MSDYQIVREEGEGEYSEMVIRCGGNVARNITAIIGRLRYEQAQDEMGLDMAAEMRVLAHDRWETAEYELGLEGNAPDCIEIGAGKKSSAYYLKATWMD